MNGLILVCIGLIAMLGVICAVIYSRLTGFQSLLGSQREQLDRIEISLHAMVELQSGMQKKVDQLATDAHQREVYHGTEDRHQLAIKDAKSGCNMAILVQRHGLSSDEAALIFALHGRSEPETEVDAGVDTDTDTEGEFLSSWAGSD